MGLLSGGIEAVFGAAFGGIYPSGTLHLGLTGPVYDLEGRIVGYAGGGGVPIKVQRDRATYAMRQAEGFSEGDVALIVLSAGLTVEITTDHEITDGHGRRWKVASADRDAANSHWVCRGRAASVPEGDDPDESGS